MAIVVEDGTGKADAESYITVAAFKTYATDRGLAITAYTDTQIEQALRRATTWLDATYGSRFGGLWVKDTQALQWPRGGAPYRQGYFAVNIVPCQIIQATAEAAMRELKSPGSLTPDVIPGQVKKAVRVEGAVSVEYAVGAGGVGSQTPVITVINGILAGMLCGSSPYSGRAVRG